MFCNLCFHFTLSCINLTIIKENQKHCAVDTWHFLQVKGTRKIHPLSCSMTVPPDIYHLHPWSPEQIFSVHPNWRKGYSWKGIPLPVQRYPSNDRDLARQGLSSIRDLEKSYFKKTRGHEGCVESKTRELDPTFPSWFGLSPLQCSVISHLFGRGWLPLVACNGPGGFAMWH